MFNSDVEKDGGVLRTIYEIQKQIAEVNHHLHLLILEKKLTLQILWGYEKQAEKLAEEVIEKMKK